MAESHASKEAEALKKTQQEQRDKMAKGKPTPTQEENDRAISGEQVKLADDGSGPDPNVPQHKKEKS
jgi:hypothetical protein